MPSAECLQAFLASVLASQDKVLTENHLTATTSMMIMMQHAGSEMSRQGHIVAPLRWCTFKLEQEPTCDFCWFHVLSLLLGVLLQ